MNSTTTSSDHTPLPAPLVRLLDAYTAAHPGTRVRLLASVDRQNECLYPADAGDWKPAVALSVDVEDGPALSLEAEHEGPQIETLARALGMSLDYEREARSAARELAERYEEINLLYFISEILASVLSVPDAATRILSEVADVLGARRASLWVHDDEYSQLNLAAAVGEDGLSGPIQVDDPESATAKVFREKQALNLERGSVLSGLPRLEPRPHGREAFLSVPINYTPPEGATKTVGVITLVGRRSNVRFSAGDARLLTAIASQVGAALETQRLVRESVRQERMVRELELAHDLQLKLLPDPSSFEGEHNIAARCVPAESVGGDFYQLFRLSGDRLGVMIGDVSSHGFSAALIMALTMSAVGIYAQESGPPAEVLRRVHRALIKELESTEMYLTLFYGVLDITGGHLVYANAGHPHAFRLGSDGQLRRLGATDPPLGIVPLDQYGEAVVTWEHGTDTLCLFTDGLSDAYDGGEKELLAELAKVRAKPLNDILEHLFRRAQGGDGRIPSDDRTALLVRD